MTEIKQEENKTKTPRETALEILSFVLNLDYDIRLKEHHGWRLIALLIENKDCSSYLLNVDEFFSFYKSFSNKFYKIKKEILKNAQQTLPNKEYENLLEIIYEN